MTATLSSHHSPRAAPLKVISDHRNPKQRTLFCPILTGHPAASNYRLFTALLKFSFLCLILLLCASHASLLLFVGFVSPSHFFECRDNVLGTPFFSPHALCLSNKIHSHHSNSPLYAGAPWVCVPMSPSHLHPIFNCPFDISSLICHGLLKII